MCPVAAAMRRTTMQWFAILSPAIAWTVGRASAKTTSCSPACALRTGRMAGPIWRIRGWNPSATYAEAAPPGGLLLCKKEGPAEMVDAGARTREREERSNLWLTKG